MSLESLESYNSDLSSSPEATYTVNNIRELAAGVCFAVTGTVLPDCSRFEVNLILNNSDVALHVNPRFSPNYISYNSLNVNRGWENEENCSLIEFNLKRGKQFILHILVTNEAFLICVNGRHCHEFWHRRPYWKICSLEVKGDVRKVAVEQCYIENYPLQPVKFVPRRTPEVQSRIKEKRLSTDNKQKLQAEQMPYTGLLELPFTNGQKLHIIGRLNTEPNRFHVNLQTSAYVWPHPNILFHLNPRFEGERVIVCNSWRNGWAHEERSEIPRDIQPGTPFYLRIDCTVVGYKVILNGKRILEFVFRDNPRLVNAVHVQGDITLYDIAIEKALTARIGYGES
ncbi:galectin-9-like [Anopheles darlingi]|uniref:galectin-9-like n=1 Tax=Anopheles darlingi TaxID=43151 RepID=UPI002100186C|nr:galectin-9-like [Anopheles darlingi]